MSIGVSAQDSAEHPAYVPTILVVDDSVVDRHLTTSIINKSGQFLAISVSDGEQGLEEIARNLPAAVVTDLQLPGMSGLELVLQIHKLYPGLPVVLITAYGSEEIAIEALRAGASHYVPKKLLARDLVQTLESVLSVVAIDQGRQKLMQCLEMTCLKFKLENNAELIAPLISMLQEELAGMAICDRSQLTRVGVALQESLANALYHGNLEVSSDLRQTDEKIFYKEAKTRSKRSPYNSRHIYVSADFSRDRATFVIRDEGPGFDTSKLDAAFDPENLTRIGGRGMLLVRTFMDDVQHNPAGNEITLVKYKQK